MGLDVGDKSVYGKTSREIREASGYKCSKGEDGCGQIYFEPWAEIRKLEVEHPTGDFIGPNGPIGAPGVAEGFVPVWGPARAAVNDFETGHPIWGTFNSALAISDVCLVKSLCQGLVKGGFKLGSHSWGATRKWYGITRNLPKNTPAHHWLIEQNSKFGKVVPEVVKNQPYNLLPVADTAFHTAIHHTMRPWQRLIYATPSWYKAFVFSGAGRGIEASAELADTEDE